MAACCLACKRVFSVEKGHFASCRKLVRCRLCAKFVPPHLLARHIACHAGRISDYQKQARADVKLSVAKHACPKCKKTFVRQRWRDLHVKACATSTVPPASAPAIKIIDVDPDSVVAG